MNGSRIRKLVFLGLFLGLFILVARLFYPFLTIILWSGLIYALLYKIYGRVAKRRNGLERREPAKTLLAGSFALGAVVLIVIPAIFLGRAVFYEVGDLAREFLKTIERNPGILDLTPESPIGGFIFRLSGGQIDLSNVNLILELKRFVTGRSGQLIGFSGTILKDVAGIVINLAFMIFTLYFFFIDGEHLARTFISAVPIENAYTKLFLRKMRDSGRQLLVGYFLVALFQATMMFLICLVMGVKGPLVLAALTAIGSFIPMVGTAIVWLPTAIGIALSGHVTKAIVFLAVSAALVATLDNFIRPILLHDRLKIHPLLIFFSILGGLKIFGFNGLVLGPLILMLFFSATELYNQAYESPATLQRRRKDDIPTPEANPDEGKEGKGAKE
jgi:predicted PurR-regulated permease PerM